MPIKVVLDCRDVRSEHGTSWILLADPEGNELCVCDGGGAA